MSLTDARATVLDDPTVHGSDLCRALTRHVDQWLQELYARQVGDRDDVALVAVGGYGRGELCPHSDLDVLLLHDLEGDAINPIASELTGVSSNVGITLTADEVPVRGVNVGMLFVSFPITRENLEDPTRVLNLVRERVDGFVAANPHGVVSLRVQSPRNGPPMPPANGGCTN